MSYNQRRVRVAVSGTVAGVIAWIVGYAFTYLVVAPDVRDSPLHQLVEAFEGEPATYEMVGWVFFNAHFVQTMFRDVPILGSSATTFIGSEDGFTPWLYGLPILLLVVTGFALAWYHRVDGPGQGAVSGAILLPGYLLGAVVGVFVFEVAIGGARGSPELLPAVFLAGFVYPLALGGLGGALGGMLGSRTGGGRQEARIPE